MCGLLGSFAKQQSLPELEARLQSALRALHHRGPDDRGLLSFPVAGGHLSLGHTRLSIIDLTPGGHQPMGSQDGRYNIVFNGEIYNYRELRQELKALGLSFHTDSDTEVLLAVWTHWGVSGLRRLIGMFAFAVFDRVEESLTLVRDAFGIKPLFYAPTADGLLFASEMPALLVLREGSPQLNPQRAYDYLIHGVQDTGFETFVQGVYHLPPAHWLRLDLHQPAHPKTERWWNPSIAETSRLDISQAADQLRELFLDSVRLHLRSDVSLGVALSGGVDSSAIACCVRHLEPQMDLHTFSYIGEHGSRSEETWIDVINAHVQAISHKVYIQPSDLERDLDDLMRTQGEPFGGTAMYAQWRVFQRARESGIAVLLEGQGGDEVLGGYSGYPGQVMLSSLEAGRLTSLFKFASHFHDWEGREGLNPWRALIGQLLPDATFNIGNRMLNRSPVPSWLNRGEIEKARIALRPIRPSKSTVNYGRRLVETLFQSLTVHGLPHLLRYGDRNAMRFSVENRVPFLTLPIAEFMLSQPESYFISECGETKALFRLAMRNIVPDSILDRRDKVGFDTPMREWMQYRIRSELYGIGGEVDSSLQFISLSDVKQFITQAIESSNELDWQVWRLFNLIRWSKDYCSGSATF